MNRIDRLTAILIQLQTKRIVKAEEIAERFDISLRTVYRDVKALMEGGVPIGSEAGKGYFIVDGYHLPPVMFTEDEASSMMVATKLVEKMGDKSIRSAFESAMHKIKSVLNESEKDHLQNLETLIEVFPRSRYEEKDLKEYPDNFMTNIQRAVSRKEVLQIDYCSADGNLTQRQVEPIGIFYYSMAWHLIGWCRLRNGYRDFRADRIKKLNGTGEFFEGRNEISLKEYFQSMFQSNQDLIRAVIIFEKSALRSNAIYGSTTLEDLGDRIRAEFLLDNLNYMARWLLMFGTSVQIESPEELQEIVAELTHDLYQHHSRSQVL